MPGDHGLWAYIDPTGGLPPSSWAALLTALAAAGAAAWTAFRHGGLAVLAGIRRRPRSVLGGLVLLASVGCLMAIWRQRSPLPEVAARALDPSPVRGPRVVVLALDGLDPRLLERYVAAGRLPEFDRLAREGLYHELQTTPVPQSPVCWCSFLTGSDAGRHGVYDFLHRDPATYGVDLSLTNRSRPAIPWRGSALWDQPTLARLGTVALRMPMTFPPPKLPGRLLAGMGVWDVRGTEGTYFYFASPPPKLPRARGLIGPLERDGEGYTGVLPGPYRAGQKEPPRLAFRLLPRETEAELTVGGRTWRLPWGAWSDWIEIDYRLGPLGLERIPALTRMIAQRTAEGVSLYVSPPAFDPRRPAYPLSHPPGYAAELVQAVGLYSTRGMPFDTQAVTDGALSDERFLDQAQTLTAETERMLFHELARTDRGLVFAYFEGPDIVQHLFWRGIDPLHPLHADPETVRHRDAIPELYAACDALVGRVRAALGPGDALLVLSDHGFAPFRRAVHLNAVLRELGYLRTRADAAADAELLEGVDWSATRAYALGFNAVYLHLSGRERDGIVPPVESDALSHELAAALAAWQDPETGETPVLRVRRTCDVYAADLPERRPDLIVGYRRGYRASWQTALGGVPATTSEPNRQKWSGDHCLEASEVPGLFLSSDPRLDAAALTDVGAAIEAYLRARHP